MKLQLDENGFAIPAFPLTAGKINKTNSRCSYVASYDTKGT